MQKERGKKAEPKGASNLPSNAFIGDIITSSRALCNNAGLQHAMVQKASL